MSGFKFPHLFQKSYLKLGCKTKIQVRSIHCSWIYLYLHSYLFLLYYFFIILIIYYLVLKLRLISWGNRFLVLWVSHSWSLLTKLHLTCSSVPVWPVNSVRIWSRFQFDFLAGLFPGAACAAIRRRTQGQAALMIMPASIIHQGCKTVTFESSPSSYIY